MLVLVYEGDPGDPMAQYVKVARAKSLEDASRKFPHAINVQAFEKTNTQEPPNIAKLRRGMPVWSF